MNMSEYENENSENNKSNMKKIKQSISVPFIWEERPGTPKKDWKPSPTTMIIPPIVTPPPPIKLVASIPFKWEEKPGKPLPCLSEADIISTLSPPRYSEEDDDDIEEEKDCGDRDGVIDDYGNDKQDKMWESEVEACDFESFDSFSSAAPSVLLANGFMSSLIISSAIPVVDNGDEPGSPVSEAGSSTSSYATGTTSLAGSSFLEWLFPSISGKVSGQEKSATDTDTDQDEAPPKLKSKDLDIVNINSCNTVIRRPSTLGELIMMSRRRSYHRKAIQIMKRNPSMEFMKRNAYRCGIFGGSNNGGIGQQLNQKWKKQFQIKIM